MLSIRWEALKIHLLKFIFYYMNVWKKHTTERDVMACPRIIVNFSFQDVIAYKYTRLSSLPAIGGTF